VATISRLLKIIGLFCKRALLNRRYSVKETYNVQEPTDSSHHIRICAQSVTIRMKLQVDGRTGISCVACTRDPHDD